MAAEGSCINLMFLGSPYPAAGSATEMTLAGMSSSEQANKSPVMDTGCH